jgi:formamidopyrimidine-DNA glycosylase
MPELPEVQTVVDSLNRLRLAGCCITAAGVYWPRTIADMTPAAFCKKIKGHRIRRITRRGKYIVMGLSQGLTLLIHLRMTGRLTWMLKGKARNKHEHVILDLGERGELRFQDTRKFGRFLLTRAPRAVLRKLGPEPLSDDFSLERFHKMLHTRRRQIKPLLLNQEFIAGMGNIYVDEALWKAGIHPLRISCSLSKKEITALHRAIPHVLRTGLKNMGTSLGAGAGNFTSVAGRKGHNADQLKVFRRGGQGCPRCGSVIQRILVGQRGSHICPTCQVSG